MESGGALDIERLLAHGGWLKPLARSLVAGAADADDLVQQTWLEALRRPPRSGASAKGWLAAVLRNFARRRLREKKRRREREIRAARPEMEGPTPEELLDRLEMHRLVAGEVARLDEPYRSTVILRYFEELEVAEIARRQGIPADTVKTRLRRALEELRERLDRRHGGDRSAWALAILPIAGLGALPSAASAGTIVSEEAAAGTLAAAGSPPAASLIWTLTGGLIMGKTLSTIGIAVILGLGAGWMIGLVTARTGKEAAMEKFGLVPAERLEELKGKYDEVSTSLAKARGEAARIATERDGLKAQEPAPEVPAAAEAGPSNLPITFGKVAELEALRTADWGAIGEAVSAMNGLFLELVEAEKKGGSPPADWQSKVLDLKDRLDAFARKLIGKVPTNGSGNGEVTHPLIAANIMASILDRGGMPLTAEQMETIVELGNAYDEQYGNYQEEYVEDTPKAERLIDEIELKRSTLKAMLGALTPEQQALASPPDLQDRMGVDPLSPLLMTMNSIRWQPADSAEALGASMTNAFAGKFGLDEAQAARAAPLFEVWLRDVGPLLEPGTVEDSVGLDGKYILTAARAYLAVVQGLLAQPGLSEESRRSLLSDTSWFLPVLPKKSPAPPAAPE